MVIHIDIQDEIKRTRKSESRAFAQDPQHRAARRFCPKVYCSFDRQNSRPLRFDSEEVLSKGAMGERRGGPVVQTMIKLCSSAVVSELCSQALYGYDGLDVAFC